MYESSHELTPLINDVLKALNHELRRDILTYLREIGRAVSFTELLETMNYTPKTSGQFFYHLKLLLDPQLISKTNDNKYILTEIGERASLMLELVNDTSKPSLGNQLLNAFKNLSPIEELIVTWDLFPILVLILLIQRLLLNRLAINLFDSIVLFIVFITSVLILLLTYRSLQSFLAMFVTSSIIWLVFLQKNRLILGIIWFLNIIAVITIVTPTPDVYDTIRLLIGSSLILISIILSMYHLWKNYRKKIRIPGYN